MTAPYYADDTVRLYLGDCREVLAGLSDASVDSIVTDPPAGIAFMGKTWDTDKGGRDAWVAWLTSVMEQAYQVLKPGGHALVWALPRTSHWTATALEDAGFEIRDCIVHLFGSGFPKSLDVGKAIDRARDDGADIRAVTAWLANARDVAGLTNRQIDEAFGMNGMAGHWTSTKSQPAVPTIDQWERLRDLLGFGPEMDAEVWRLNGRKGQPGEAWDQREVIGQRVTGIGTGRGSVAYIGDSGNRDVTAPVTDAARQWDGWGTALKPGQEHWWLVRKPLAGTVANNVLTYGTGALNISGCRVEPTGESRPRVGEESQERRYSAGGNDGFAPLPGVRGGDPAGRWPTNVVFTHSASCIEGEACLADCPVGELNRQSGNRPSGGRSWTAGDADTESWRRLEGRTGVAQRGDYERGKDHGGASRYFPTFRYEAKAPSSERPKVNGLAHPTVKPVALMSWLVRLVTPPGGLVLDPFAGSGTTAEACLIEGFRCVLVELEEPHAELIKARLSKPLQPGLFGGAL